MTAPLDFAQYHHGLREPITLADAPPLPRLALTVDDQSFTYALNGDQLSITPGREDAEAEVTLAADDWRGLVADLESVPGLLYGGRLLAQSGLPMAFISWEPVLRCLYTGRPIFPQGGLPLTDGNGRTLDAAQSFTLSDNSSVMRSFLDATGYLLVKDVFSAGELAQFREAARDLHNAAVEGDQDSWWGKDDAGQSVLCRVLTAGRHPALAPLYEHPAIAMLSGLLPDGIDHAPAGDKDSITVIFKNPGVREGLSDLPWHRDCGMGGHAVMCPTYVMSLYLQDATEESGCLQFLPGSQDYAVGFADGGALPGAVTVGARAGDITVHIGDVMHAAPPPTGSEPPFRDSILLAFQPQYENHRGERHYNDALLGDESGQVPHLRQMASERND